MDEWKKKFWMIVIIVAVVFAILSSMALRWAYNKVNKECLEYGLDKGCDSKDYCTKDCIDIGYTYNKYECGGAFCSIEDCWCFGENKPIQIW